MKPIRHRLNTIISDGDIWVDPFVRNRVFKHKMTYTNDLNTDFVTNGIDGNPSHLDAIDFLQTLPDNFADGVLFDPPYT